jgi:D-sedoheptulose 7-phosphate isomerase
VQSKRAGGAGPLPGVDTEPSYSAAIALTLADRQLTYSAALTRCAGYLAPLSDAAELLVRTLRHGNKVLTAGNGGSAAEAQHFAAELVGRFKQDRQALAALALSCDMSILTAVANDYGYDQVFARQIQALGRPGDLFIAFSTSGESLNLLKAVTAARDHGVVVIAVTGERSSRLGAMADVAVRMPAGDTAVAQELHTLVTHILCQIAESELAAQGPGL